MPNDLTWGRREFLSALQRVLPGAVEALRQDVGPAFQRAASRGPLAKESKDARGHWLDWPPHSDALAGAIKTEFDAWANAFRLRGRKGPTPAGEEFVEWLRTDSLYTLWSWASNPRAPATWDPPNLLPVYARVSEPPAFEFHTSGWAEYRETRGAFVARIRTELEGRLQEHLDAADRDRPDWVVAHPDRLSPEHFGWLVHFQCGGLSMNAMLNQKTVTRAHITRQGLAKAIKSAAAKVVGEEGCLNWLGLKGA